MRQLDVYMNCAYAGRLSECGPGRDYSFAYDKEYLAAAAPVPVSVNLPCRSEVFRSETLFPFFINILPEGANKRAVCRLCKVSESDAFGLLMAMSGADFIGAVSFKEVQ